MIETIKIVFVEECYGGKFRGLQERALSNDGGVEGLERRAPAPLALALR